MNEFLIYRCYLSPLWPLYAKNAERKRAGRKPANFLESNSRTREEFLFIEKNVYMPSNDRKKKKFPFENFRPIVILKMSSRRDCGGMFLFFEIRNLPRMKYV